MNNQILKLVQGGHKILKLYQSWHMNKEMRWCMHMREISERLSMMCLKWWKFYEERTTRFHGESSNQPKGNGGDWRKPLPLPPPPPSPPSSPSSSSTSSPSHTPPRSVKGHANYPLLNLDVKFELVMYNGEVNVENFDHWVCHIEFYCKIQRIKDDVTKIQLSSLCLESASLIWWEART